MASQEVNPPIHPAVFQLLCTDSKVRLKICIDKKFNTDFTETRLHSHHRPVRLDGLGKQQKNQEQG